MVAADFNDDREAKLKEYFEFYKTSVEKYLGEVLIYEWHYFPKDKIPQSLRQSILVDGNGDSMYKACMEIFGQKYWQRVLISYEMKGALIAPNSLGYDYTVDQYVDLLGFYEKQLGIHGECHVLESRAQEVNSVLNKSDPKNWTLDPNEKLKKFWLENGWCHYVVQKDVDRYTAQYEHTPVKWNDPKTKRAQVDFKEMTKYWFCNPATKDAEQTGSTYEAGQSGLAECGQNVAQNHTGSSGKCYTPKEEAEKDEKCKKANKCEITNVCENGDKAVTSAEKANYAVGKLVPGSTTKEITAVSFYYSGSTEKVCFS